MIGDVAGHGIEPSITAFQVKYLLRTFCAPYRDPAQALEELNKVLSTSGRPEDLVSVCVVVFDTEAGTAASRLGRPPRGLAVAGLRDAGPALDRPPADPRPRRGPTTPGSCR